jgi:crotonobetaine/carnitine-CoA ligase
MSAQMTDPCFVTLLRSWATQAPDRPYFTCEGETITFGELWRRSGDAALWLKRHGIAGGDLISGLSYNSVGYLVLLYGCLRLGAVFAPLNPSLVKDELIQTLKRIKPKVMIASAEMAQQHGDELRSVLSLLTLEDGLREGGAGSTEAPPAHHWKPAEWSWVVFSGATTGLPKGIMLPHGFGFAHAQRVVRAIKMTAEDKWLSNLQMCHAWLNFVVMGGSLLVGAQCAATRWFSASRWLDQVRGFGATIVDPFLPMASALVAQPPTPRDRTHKVRVSPGPWGTVGEWDQRMAFETRFGIHTINCFGITEAGGLVACENLDTERKHGGTGTPTGDFEIIVADEDGCRLPSNQRGEVLYRPNRPAVMSLGYLGDAERTLETWRDLWIHSGDLGYIDEDGHIFFVGRMPHWLRRKGENVSAREVEMAIRNLPGIADAAVLPVPSELGDDDIKALVVLASGVARTPAEIHEELKAKLAFFKVPRFIELVDSFPRTIKAEPDRKRLTAFARTGREWDAEAVRRAHVG